ncbi:MAG TPA: DNA-directed RNA polymerase subunit delta [Firmicutes bacterium]|nr:DNA-directed RNA polymerase subunit delta [Bacillota bacterium]
MKLRDLSKEELEAMSYDDIALKILEETNRQMKINELFKEVCNLLSMTEDEFVNKLPAFFDVLSTDHRFIMLENGLWDLKTKHAAKIVIPTDDDEIEEDLELEEAEDLEDDVENEEIFTDDDSDDDLTDDDDLKDLVIIDEDEEQMV